MQCHSCSCPFMSSGHRGKRHAWLHLQDDLQGAPRLSDCFRSRGGLVARYVRTHGAPWLRIQIGYGLGIVHTTRLWLRFTHKSKAASQPKATPTEMCVWLPLTFAHESMAATSQLAISHITVCLAMASFNTRGYGGPG